MILDVAATTVPAAEFAARTGWLSKPEGLCKGDVCVPAPGAEVEDGLDVVVVTERLGMPRVVDADHGIAAFGPAALGGRALDTATVPDLTLPDADGNPFDLATLHGRKVLLVAWASW